MIASDIHGSLAATHRLLAAFDVSGACWLLLCDFLNHGLRNPLPEDYRPAEVTAELNAYRQRIIAVRGNCDSEVDEMLLDFPLARPGSSFCWGDAAAVFNPRASLSSGASAAAGTRRRVVVRPYLYSAGGAGWEAYSVQSGVGQLAQRRFPASYGLMADGRLQVLPLDGEETIA